MAEKKLINKTSIAKNITYSVFSQVISLGVSFIIGILVPKYLDEYQYAYCQIFALYVSCVGVFHFGLLDGIVLRYGQYDYADIPKRKFSSQFQSMICMLAIISIAIASFGRMFLNDVYYTIACLVCVGILSKNIFAYITYLLQITNRIKKYSLVVITQRLVHGVVVAVLLITKNNNYVLYCLADLIGDVCAIIIGVIYNKGCFLSKPISFIENLKETRLNVSSGLFLMIANWSSMMIVGGGKLFIQWNWDELSFGKASFAFSISNMFLTFASAISVVLFPSIKRIGKSELPALYHDIKQAISPALFVILLFFFPGSWILCRLLPKYSSSLLYLGVLLPIIVFISKVSLLTNNYLKAYRKERQLLYVNLFTVGIAVVFFAIGSYVLRSIEAILIGIVISVYIRYVVSDQIVIKEIKTHQKPEYIIEGILSFVFIFASSRLDLLLGFFVYLLFMVIYLFLYRKQISKMLKKRKS